jgi:protein SCO1/2
MKHLLPVVIVLIATLAHAQSAPATRPAILNRVGVDQRLGSHIPTDLAFTDESGQTVQLKSLMHGRPVLLTLVYYKCPMLCTVTLNQLTRSLNAMSATAGNQFDIITVSFDPRETPALAAEKKRTYLKSYRRPESEAGWHFLTGTEASIRELAQSVGFRYAWDDANKIYAHAAAVMVLAPDGTISRYFLGVDYPPVELQKAIDEARGGAVGPKAEQIFLYCFHYDPATGRYGLVIERAMRVLGVVTFVALAGLILLSLRRERRRVRVAEVGS